MHFSGPKGGGKLFSLRPSPFFLFTFFPEEFTHKPLGGADHMGFPHWRWEKVRSCRARSRVSGSRWEEKGANPPPTHTQALGHMGVSGKEGIHMRGQASSVCLSPQEVEGSIDG